MHREILKNTSFQIISKTLTTAIGFLITIVLARSFGAYQFGEFSKITSYIAIFYLFADFGLNAIFIKNSKSFSSLFYLRLIVSLGIFVVANILSWAFPYNQILDTGFSPFVRTGIFIFSFSIFSQSIIYSTSAIFQKKLRFDLFLVSQLVGEMFNFFIIAILVFFAQSLYLVLFSFLVSSFISAMLSLFFAKEEIKTLDLNYAKEVFLLSVPIGLMLIFNLIYFRADIILLSIFKSNQDVAFYSLAYRFFDFFIAIPLFLSNSIYPKLLDSLKNKNLFLKLTKNYLLFYLISSILIIIPVWFFSPLFSLIGESYSHSIVPFRILIISLPIFFVTSFLQWILISLDKQKFLMYVYFLAGVINIILNFIFIPSYSYLASSWITVFGELFIMIVLFIKLKQEWKNYYAK